MAEKDVAEKTLEAYNDVFADIINVLLFGGRDVIKEDELEEASPVSQYKTDGKLHAQERDVSKYWRKGNIRICLYGIENQTDIDSDMPFRVISYDGAAYRAQLLADKAGRRRQRYPVITVVLYFGETRWNKRRLMDCVDVPEELEPYVNDYRANVFEIAWLTPETVRQFKSDFRIVADYFVQLRTNKEYVPSRETIRHVHETLQLMSVLTRDLRFEEAQDLEEQQGGVTMCEVLDKVTLKGRTEGISIGRTEGIRIGRSEGRTEGIRIGKTEGIRIGRTEGIRIGKTEGAESATNALTSLFAQLYAAGRMEDAQKATADRDFLHKLMEEFHCTY